MGNLKPCPFCGSEARLKIEVSCVDTFRYEVVCDDIFCPCYGKEDDDNPSGYVEKEEAIQAWNTRDTKEIDELRECCQFALNSTEGSNFKMGDTLTIEHIGLLVNLKDKIQKALRVKEGEE